MTRTGTLYRPRRVRPTLKYLLHQHLAQVNALEQMQEEEVPLPEKEIHALLRQQGQKHIMMIAEVEGRVDGYLIYHWVGKGLEVQIDRVIVHPDDRYGDVERFLFQEICRHTHAKVYFLVREKDLGRQILLASLGYKGRKVVREHFLESGEDAFEMVYIHQGEEYAKG